LPLIQLHPVRLLGVMTGTALHDVAKRRDHDPVQFNTGFTEFPPPVLHHPMRVSPPVNRPPCPVAVVFTDLRVGPDNREAPVTYRILPGLAGFPLPYPVA